MHNRFIRILLGLSLACTLAFASPQTATKTKADAKASQPASSNKVDLNSASQNELEALPGVGAATAKKIIAGRPYASASDLQKSGVSAKTIEKITPLVTASGSAPSTNSSATAAKPSSDQKPQPSSASSGTSQANSHSAQPSPGAMSRNTSTDSATAQQPPQPGMVWANLDTKVYHMPGQRWYGKTKHGQFMTKDDAEKAGFRAAKE